MATERGLSVYAFQTNNTLSKSLQAAHDLHGRHPQPLAVLLLSDSQLHHRSCCHVPFEGFLKWTNEGDVAHENVEMYNIIIASLLSTRFGHARICASSELSGEKPKLARQTYVAA